MQKYKRPRVEVTCCYCKETFVKALSEYKRTEKKNGRHYCSLSCHGKDNHQHLDPYRGSASKVDITKYAANRKDEYSGLRVHRSRARNRTKDFDLSLQHLKEVWERQDGKCIYTKVALIHPDKKGKGDPVFTASLDRIDSAIGYIDGNVQFISIVMNHMKGDMSHEKTLEIIELIKKS